MSAFTIDIISIILGFSILQGLIFSAVAFVKRQRLLGALMLVLVWYQLEFLLVREVIEWKFDLFYGTRYGSWLLFGPLLYLYALAYTNPDFKWQWKHWAYFAPFLLFTVALPLLIADVIPERGKYYGMLTVMKFPTMGLSAIQLFYGVLFFLQFAFSAFFTFLSYRTARKYTMVVENNFSHINYKWLSRIIFSAAAILISAIVFFTLLYFSSGYERWMDHIYVIPVTLLIYGIHFAALRNSKILEKPLVPLRSWEKYEKSSLTEDLAKEIVSKLESVLESEKPYLNNELTLSMLADQLSISPHFLSQVINERLHTSFYNLINQHRVNEAKKILTKENGAKTILEVAFASGFNNKVSFNTYFKKHTGMTPRDFIKTNS